MAFAAFNAPSTATAALSRTMVARPALYGRQRHNALLGWAVVAIAMLAILSIITLKVTEETGSILIGLGAADLAFLIATSMGLSLRSAAQANRSGRLG